MADISSLTDLQAGEPLDHDIYADAKEAPPPPRRGRYIVQAPLSFTFGATRQNFLSARVDPVIQGPTAEGYEIRRTSLSAKPFKRGKVTVSQIGDYLRAVFGAGAPRPSSPQEQADAIESTAGRTYQIDGDWEGYCVRCKAEVKGESKFPLVKGGAAGERDPWMECPTAECVDENGTHSRIRARFKVDRYVSAAS